MDYRGEEARTSLQMRAAPKGAVYVWSNFDVTWPVELARRLKREDLLVMPRTELTEHNAIHVRKLKIGTIVVDKGNFDSPQDVRAPVLERVLGKLKERGWKVRR